jgi:hypothetical protein
MDCEHSPSSHLSKHSTTMDGDDSSEIAPASSSPFNRDGHRKVDKTKLLLPTLDDLQHIRMLFASNTEGYHTFRCRISSLPPYPTASSYLLCFPNRAILFRADLCSKSFSLFFAASLSHHPDLRPHRSLHTPCTHLLALVRAPSSACASTAGHHSTM